MKNYYGSLQGKVVVITGASSGVGRAMAIALATEGTRMILAARRQEALEELAGECTELGAEAIAVVCDVKEQQEVTALMQKAVEHYGKIDVWINNAGVLAVGAVDAIPADVNEGVIQTNLLGYIHGTYAVLPLFKQQGYGQIINNISVGGWYPVPYMAVYGASKFGLKAFSDALKGELRDYSHIHVSDLYPGFLDTPGLQHAANYTGRELMPSPPLYKPQKVADAVVRLIKYPQSKVTIGAFPAFLKMAYLCFPSLSRNITAMFFKKYLKSATRAHTTSGNVLHTVPYGTGIEGAWRENLKKEIPKKQLLLAAGAVAALIVLARRI